MPNLCVDTAFAPSHQTSRSYSSSSGGAAAALLDPRDSPTLQQQMLYTQAPMPGAPGERDDVFSFWAMVYYRCPNLLETLVSGFKPPLKASDEHGHDT
jgi:hypothetical protein